MTFTFIDTALFVLATALLASIIFRALRLPVILGYLTAGIIVGPHILGWLPNTHAIQEVAEFGVALLLFTIGLEFSFTKLMSLRYQVFILGGLQLLITFCVTFFVALLLNISAIEAFIIGSIISMSSTAIVLKQLYSQFEIQTQHGLNAVGILLFQDLAVIVLLVIIASLASVEQNHFSIELLWALTKGLSALVLIVAVGRWLLRPLFHMIAKTRIIELFSLTVLLISLGFAWFTNEMGMSYALGAFIAGMLLGETEYKHQINSEIRPFRDVLLGLFFVSIGMLVNITIWLDAWQWIMLLVLGLVIGKLIVIFLLCRITKNDMASSLRTAIILAQGGEFGVAILTLALAKGLLSPLYAQVILASLLISFALAPILIQFNKQIGRFIFPKISSQKSQSIQKDILKLTKTLENHVIICGFGRVGHNIATFLKEVHYAYIALDMDTAIIKKNQAKNVHLAYGNTTNLEVLQSAGLDKAHALVISFTNLSSSLSIIEQVRTLNKKIPILVRCNNEKNYQVLHEAGATKVITETFEASLSLTSDLLNTLNISQSKVDKVIEASRNKHYQLLYKAFPGSFQKSSDLAAGLHKYILPVQLPPHSQGINQPLGKLPLQGISVISIRRKNISFKPKSNTKLRENDFIILFGNPESLDKVEHFLLQQNKTKN